jgi:O-acetyl-ADP-ribose deacetylase (regulator of RNase III)
MTLIIDAIEGDITHEPADALITATNSRGMYLGRVDKAINSVAGNLFHNQVDRAMPLSEGQTILARGMGHGGSFHSVLFVVDNLVRPLNRVALTALRAAESAGIHRLTLPMMRTGAQLGRVEPTAEIAVHRLAQAVKAFAASNPRSVSSIRFVIFDDGRRASLLRQKLRQIES